MPERFTSISTSAGLMNAFVSQPEGAGPFPAVVVYMDVWGFRQELFDVARQLSTLGYYAVLPNTYHRHGDVRFEHRDDQGRMRSLETLSDDIKEAIRTQMWLLTDAMVVEDAAGILRFFQSESVAAGPKGVLGYCMGGRHAFAVAGNYPDDFRATVSLHGTRLVTDAPDFPHRLADAFRGEIYCGFAEHDSLAPPSTIATLAQTLSGRADVRYDYAVHPGTVHGYALPDRDIFDRDAYEKDWARIATLLETHVALR